MTAQSEVTFPWSQSVPTAVQSTADVMERRSQQQCEHESEEQDQDVENDDSPHDSLR